MKKLSFALLVLMTLFNSCTKDNSNENKESPLSLAIVGKWHAEMSEIRMTDNGTSGKSSNFNIKIIGKGACYKIDCTGRKIGEDLSYKIKDDKLHIRDDQFTITEIENDRISGHSNKNDGITETIKTMVLTRWP